MDYFTLAHKQLPKDQLTLLMYNLLEKHFNGAPGWQEYVRLMDPEHFECLMNKLLSQVVQLCHEDCNHQEHNSAPKRKSERDQDRGPGPKRAKFADNNRRNKW